MTNRMGPNVHPGIRDALMTARRRCVVVGIAVMVADQVTVPLRLVQERNANLDEIGDCEEGRMVDA